MKTAAAYIRVSTEDQVEYSPASQLEKIREYAKRNGYILPEEFVFADEGISGRNTAKRPEFNRMIGIAKQKPKPFDAILLWKFSRFARNREDSIVYKSMLRKQCGIDVISISENVGDDKMSVLIEAMIEAMDEYYSINLGEEVKRGMNEKVSRGEAVTIPSFGYDIKDGVYIPDPVTAPALKRIFEDFANGKGMRTIAVELNDNGFRTRRGNLFQNRTVQYILNNPVYIGKIRWTPTGKTDRDFHNPDTVIIDGTHEPLIDKELWNTVQQKLDKAPKTKYMRSDAPKQPFMLQGLVRCNSCGATLCQSVNGSVQCYSYAHGTCRVSHSVSLKKLNVMFIQSLQTSVELNEFKIDVDYKRSLNQSNNETILAQIERENTKLRRAREAYESEIYTLDEYKDSKRIIEEKIRSLKSKLTDAPTNDPDAEIKALRRKILSVLPAIHSPALSENEKNSIIKSFISKVVFYKPSGDLELYFYT